MFEKVKLEIKKKWKLKNKFGNVLGTFCFVLRLVSELKMSNQKYFLNIIKNYQLVDLWMDTNLMCLGEKTSFVLNEIKWKKIFIFKNSSFFVKK